MLYAVADTVTAHLLRRMRPDARSLSAAFVPGKPRTESYDEIAAELVARVRTGAAVCAVFYGHPGVFVRPAHAAVAQVRSEGYPARMLPGVSALDCLFADLGLDPAEGLQSFEATSFLVCARVPDVTTVLVLWQVGALGEGSHRERYDLSHVRVLVDHLQRFYPPEHETTVYEASPIPVCDPIVDRVRLTGLVDAALTPASTIVIPPLAPAVASPAMVAALGLG